MVFNLYLIFILNRKSFFRIFVFVFDLYVMEKVRIKFHFESQKFLSDFLFVFVFDSDVVLICEFDLFGC